MLLTRAFTYALPIGLGAVAVVGWRLRRPSEHVGPTTDGPELVLEAAG